MNKTQYDMIYLAACGVDGVIPEKEFINEVDIEKLYHLSRTHFVDALVGTALKQAGVILPKEWTEHCSKAIRKAILFDTERAKLLAFLEQKEIWYLPLKGIVLKDYYPAIGTRQMSDNDILFDSSFSGVVQAYMESQGYEAVSVGTGVHDSYKKEPVYNFELHRALYGGLYQDGWAEYYKNIKDRLILDKDSSYGYHFTDEDFYVYIMSHAYKHYIGSGTGLRTLLDFYVYLKAKPEMDFAYIEKECEALGIASFEKKNRSLCKKVFPAVTLRGTADLQQRLSAEETDMLCYYLSSGVYGTVERGIENSMKKFGKKPNGISRLKYLWKRLFPGYETYKHYAGSYKSKAMQSLIGWFRRLFVVLFTGKRREDIVREIKIVKKVK